VTATTERAINRRRMWISTAGMVNVVVVGKDLVNVSAVSKLK